MSSDNGLKPTSAAEARKLADEGVVIPLFRSGFNARIGPVSIDKLLLAGEIPDILTATASSIMFTEKPLEELFLDKEALESYSKIVNIILYACFREPRMAVPGQEPAEDEITPDHVEFNDRMSIVNNAISGVRSLMLFRDEQAEYVSALSNLQGNLNKAKRSRRRK